MEKEYAAKEQAEKEHQETDEGEKSASQHINE